MMAMCNTFQHDAYKVSPWTSKHPKMAQPDLDYMPPEAQLETSTKVSNSSFDMFSLGMVLCAIFNGGHSLIQAGHNVANYSKQLDKVCRITSAPDTSYC